MVDRAHGWRQVITPPLPMAACGSARQVDLCPLVQAVGGGRCVRSSDLGRCPVLNGSSSRSVAALFLLTSVVALSAASSPSSEARLEQAATTPAGSWRALTGWS